MLLHPQRVWTATAADDALDVRRSLPDSSKTLLAALPQMASEARGRLKTIADVRYGPTRDEYLDLFLADKPNAPLHLFFHGGYWRAFGAKDFSFIAEPLVAAGISVGIVNYALVPKVSLGEVVRQGRSVVAWAWANAASFGADPKQISISGHSAGGQMVGMIRATDWQGDYGLPDDIVHASVAIAGIFDLTPIAYSFLQPVLQVDLDDIQRWSPLLHIGTAKSPIGVFCGADDLPGFLEQSRAYADALAARGHTVTHGLVDGLNHFDIMQDLAEGGELFGKLAAVIGA